MTDKKRDAHDPKHHGEKPAAESEAKPAAPKTPGNGETKPDDAPAEAKPAPAAPLAAVPAAPEPSAKELTDHLQRIAAEFENYKKRSAREMAVQQEIGLARAMEAALPALDSLTASLATPAVGPDAEAWRAGLEKVHRQLWTALEKLGLTVVRAEKGDALDPHIHEVLLTQPSSDYPSDKILQVLQVGYKLKDRLLRPAKVIVSAAPPAPVGAEPKEQE